MLRKLSLFIFLFLACIGLTIETHPYTYGALSGTQYGIIGLASLLALLYIIPAGLLVYRLQKKWQVHPLALSFAFIGGMFIAGWLAGYANTYVHEWISHLSSQNIFYRFEDAIFAPLIEEPLKLFAVLFALYMVPTKNYKGILLLAIVAGLGFQISEDFSYILSDLLDGFSYTISGILGRTFGSISSHWLYTSLLSLGLAILWNAKSMGESKNMYRIKGIFFTLSGFLTHFAWNTPLRSMEGDLPWATGLLMALNIFIFILLYQEVEKLDRLKS